MVAAGRVPRGGAVERLQHGGFVFSFSFFFPFFLFWKTSMGRADLHVRPLVPMGALERLGERVEPGEAAQ